MKKLYINILTASMAIVTLAGCASEESVEQPAAMQESPSFRATIAGETRAFDRYWEEMDEIGITGSDRTNVCYFTNRGDGEFVVKNYGEQIYFLTDSETDFTGYYPWYELGESESEISVETKNQDNRKSFDFLWAKSIGKKDAPDVELEFGHRMAKLYLNVIPGKSMTYEEMKKSQLTLTGIAHTGTFNVEDGSTTVGELKEKWVISDYADFNDETKTLTYTLILFPQALTEGLEFLAEFNIGEDDCLSLRANVDLTSANSAKDGDSAKNEFVTGRQYNLNVTLDKTAIVLEKCNIAPWTEVRGSDITVD